MHELRIATILSALAIALALTGPTAAAPPPTWTPGPPPSKTPASPLATPEASVALSPLEPVANPDADGRSSAGQLSTGWLLASGGAVLLAGIAAIAAWQKHRKPDTSNPTPE